MCGGGVGTESSAAAAAAAAAAACMCSAGHKRRAVEVVGAQAAGMQGAPPLRVRGRLNLSWRGDPVRDRKHTSGRAAPLLIRHPPSRNALQAVDDPGTEDGQRSQHNWSRRCRSRRSSKRRLTGVGGAALAVTWKGLVGRMCAAGPLSCAAVGQEARRMVARGGAPAAGRRGPWDSHAPRDTMMSVPVTGELAIVPPLIP